MCKGTRQGPRYGRVVLGLPLEVVVVFVVVVVVVARITDRLMG